MYLKVVGEAVKVSFQNGQKLEFALVGWVNQCHLKHKITSLAYLMRFMMGTMLQTYFYQLDE